MSPRQQRKSVEVTPSRGARARVHVACVALALGLVAPTGCNWSRFADEAEKAPVRSIGAPGGFDSADFGKSITPLSSGFGSAAAFVATSINESHLVLVQIERNGSVHSTAMAESALQDVAGSAITSVVEVPAAAAGTVPTKLLLGTPLVKNEDFGQMYTLELPEPSTTPGTSPFGCASVRRFPVPSLTSTNSGLGRGLAVGRLSGMAAPDYIVGSDNDLAVAVGGVATATSPTASLAVGACDVGYDNMQANRFLVRRPLLAAHLWADPASADQLIVGLTHTGATPGKIAFMGLGASGALECLAVEVGTAPQFGHALVTGDFDGDGHLDLLVGAPGQDAFIYRNFAAQPLGTVPPSPLAIHAAGGLDFGFAVAALNVDGALGDEAVISDPRATVGGKAGAGHVLVYKFNPATTSMELDRELADLSPEADASFGYTVNALPFCTADPATGGDGACPTGNAARVLLIGGANEVFLYYRVGEIPLQPSQTVADVRTP